MAIVKYDNSINYLNLKNFTKVDANFFFAILSRLYDVGTDEVVFSFNELRYLSAYSATSNDELTEDLYRMSKKVAGTIVEYEDDKHIVLFTLFKKFDISKSDYELRVSISEDFLPLLNNLKSKYTIFDIQQYISLDSKHSKRLFNILKQWKFNGETQFYSADELKYIFGCEDYTNRNFINLVLKPSVAELIEKEFFKNLELVIVRDEHKRGRPLKGYVFRFTREKIAKQLPDKSGESGAKAKNIFNRFEGQSYDDIAELEAKLLSN